MTPYFASLGRTGLLEILIVVALIALLFGAKRIPELFNALGRSLAEFRKGQEESNLPKKDEKSSSSDSKEADSDTTK